jgi:pyruvate dehydrogenase E2 component (dihydrolipoamide acetyltransferase)
MIDKECAEMAVEVLLAQRGMGMTEAIIVAWYVKEGDWVEEGDVLLEVESSKATEEINAPASGTVAEIRFEEGDEVEVGEVLAIIRGADESEIDVPSEPREKPQEQPEEEAVQLSPDTVPLTTIRRLTAERMWQSLQTTAQLTLHTEVDVAAAVERREALKVDAGITYTDILVWVVARALRNHPVVNGAWSEEGILISEGVNVGVAVALEEGLIVPVVKDADQKSLVEIHQEVAALIDRARAGKLTAEELSEGTFTITNLGMHRVDHFTPILNPPETAILGVGRIVRKPVAYGDGVSVRPVVGLSLTFDHRVVDGAPAAAFLDDLCAELEKATF